MKNFIFITDFLPTEVPGGAELTFEAIKRAAPEGKVTVQYLKSKNVTPKTWLTPDVHFVLGNYTGLSKESVDALCELAQMKNITYSIVEFDYKYCQARNEIVHNYHLYKAGRFEFCNCANQQLGTYTKVLFGYANKVHFMSQEQMNLIINRMPELNANKHNFRVQWSTWLEEDLGFIEELYFIQENTNRKRNGKYAIQKSDNWLKGTEEAVKYAINNKLEYDLIEGMEYRKFLTTLSQYSGFIFVPNAYDTCPRVVVEAKILGLHVITNDKVQITKELQPLSREEVLDMIYSNATRFWSSYQL